MLPSNEIQKKQCIPDHIAFIMDGNGRWAKKRNLIRTQGHDAGVKALENIVRYCKKIGVRCVTFYAFSTENWSRPKSEVEHLMNMFSDYTDKLIQEINEGNLSTYEGCSVKFIGDMSAFSAEFRRKIEYIQNSTVHNCTKFTINIAINYGGRSEIVNAVNKFILDNPNKLVTEQDICDRLYTAHVSDPDLVIRTAGEYRLSNFMLWQISYSEIYISTVLWPDFTSDELDKALRNYAERNRRFGGITEER